MNCMERFNKNYCTKCGKNFDVDYVMNSSGIPRCDKCGGIVRPDVVLYEEGLDGTTIYKSVDAIEKSGCAHRWRNVA